MAIDETLEELPISVEENEEQTTDEMVESENENEESTNEDTTSLLPSEMVSGGDSVPQDGNVAGQSVNTITIDGSSVYVVQEYTLLGDNAKPLGGYSVSEGLLLCILLVLLGQAISRIVGGVLNCKSLFKK